MERKEKICCAKTNTESKKGVVSGILYGILPHSFCLAFALFSVIGAVTASAFLKNFLLVPYFFHFLVLISLLLATISATFYLKKSDCLCVSGIKNKWRYLTILYSSVAMINILMFLVVFPALAKGSARDHKVASNDSASLSISVAIPCSGHAQLIIDELKKNKAYDINFRLPNNFEMKYDPAETSPEIIISPEIFKTYPASIN